MKLDQTRRSFLVQKKSAHVIGNCFRRRERVEHRLRANTKVFAIAWITRGRGGIKRNNGSGTQALPV